VRDHYPVAVFHVELRQFPHVARAFNLSAEQLHARIVGPWVRDQMVELDDRRWAPERAKLTIYEGPQLDTSDLGLGRGWGNVTRTGSDVTDQVVAAARTAPASTATRSAPASAAARSAPASASPEDRPAPSPVAAFKRRLLEELAGDPVPLARTPGLATDRALGVRASQRLAVAEEGVWELLHEGRVRLVQNEEAIQRDRWEAVVLAWPSWSAGTSPIFVAAANL
jgi:hypothetical protein